MARRIGNTKAGTQVHVYNSLGDFLKDAERGSNSMDAYNTNAWGGGRNFRDSVEYTKRGADESECKLAKELMEQVDASFRDREVNQWMPSVCGAYPIVADYLMGMPENMRARQPVEDNRAPVRIYVETSTSASVPVEALRRRGAAIAALVIRMSEERPTELHFCRAIEVSAVRTKVYTSVKIDTNPLSLSQVIALLANPSFTRRVCQAHTFGMVDYRGSDHLPFANGDPAQLSARMKLRETFNMQPQDILMPGGYINQQDRFMADPVAWIHEMLDAQRTMDE